MKIILNDVTEEVVDKLEDALSDLVNAHTYIWDGTANDVYKYEIDITEEPETKNDYTLEHVSVLYKSGSYMIEIMNASQVSTIEIKANEVMSILIK
jgi:hypothetical protein